MENNEENSSCNGRAFIQIEILNTGEMPPNQPTDLLPSPFKSVSDVLDHHSFAPLLLTLPIKAPRNVFLVGREEEDIFGPT